MARLLPQNVVESVEKVALVTDRFVMRRGEADRQPKTPLERRLEPADDLKATVSLQHEQ
jgi:hypothetical protein